MAVEANVSPRQCVVAGVLGRKVIRSIWQDGRAWRRCIRRVRQRRGADAVWTCALWASGLSLLCGVLACRPRVLPPRILHNKRTSIAAALARCLCLGSVDEQKVLLLRHGGLSPQAPSLVSAGARWPLDTRSSQDQQCAVLACAEVGGEVGGAQQGVNGRRERVVTRSEFPNRCSAANILILPCVESMLGWG